MSETIEARMLQKHASAGEWEQNPNFVPKIGEVIIYDSNINEDESIKKPRIKIGDGKTPIKNLNFIVGELYAQPEAPSDAGEGAVWFDTSSSGSSGNTGMGVFSNWDSHEGESGYIQNRPFFRDTTTKSFICNTIAENEIKKITEEWFNFNQMSNISIKLKNVGSYKTFSMLCNTLAELDQAIANNLSKGEMGIFFLKGSAMFFSTTSFVIFYAKVTDVVTGFPIAIVCDSDIEYNEHILNPGCYFIKAEDTYISSLSFNYTDLNYKDDYKDIFKNIKAANVYTINFSEFTTQDPSEGLVSLLTAELGKYKEGDILLVPTALLESLGEDK